MKLLKQLKWFFIYEWKRYIGTVILLIIISLLQLIPPKLLGLLIDLIIKKDICTNKILLWIGVICITAIIVYIFKYLWRILLFGAAYNLAIKLRSKIYSFLSKQNKDFYLKYRIGDLMARATNDVDRVVFAAGEGVFTLVDSLVMGSSTLIVMSTQINLKLTILSLVPMPIMIMIIKKYGIKLHYYFNKSQKLFSKLNNQTQESLTSIRMIKSFGLEKHLFKNFSKIAEETKKKNINVAKIDAKFDPIIHLAISFSNLIALMLGSYLIWIKEITIGQLTSFIMYLGLMVWPILALAWTFNIMQRGNAAWNRIKNIINNKEIKKNKIKSIPNTYGELIIKIDKFSYKKNKILKKINIKIKPKKKIGICGPIGSGKSTIIDLIQNNFILQKGIIRFHKIPIYKIDPVILKKKISVVNQTPFLFSDTILNNISLNKTNNSYEDVKYVSSIVDIHNDIKNLTNGYLTKIGEKGIILSLGQKQKISLARTLLLETEILILDNALSAVDNITECKILKNLDEWKKKKQTKIIISHKISTLMKLDEIIIIKKGRIIERGDHKKLLKNDSWYKKMYDYQTNI